jgi:DNA-binding MurR/RpiR family transcriptional regulator
MNGRMTEKPKSTGSKRKAALPRTYEEIVNTITADYDNLSDGFQQIARFFTQNPNVIALESISGIANKCRTHPSSLVRFAQHFGFAGFKPLQSVFQTRLATAAPGFRERISALEGELSASSDRGNIGHLKRLVVRDIAALQGLLGSISETDLSSAAHLLAKAETIYIAGQLRSEPIGLLMRYLMAMLHRRVIMLDPAGGLATEMATTMTPKDVLVAVAFRHYAKEVVAIGEYAADQRIPTISITDSPLSPIAKGARILFTIPEDEYTFSRTLAAPMCLVQCLAVATAALQQPSKTQPPVILSVTEKARRRRSNGLTKVGQETASPKT